MTKNKGTIYMGEDTHMQNKKDDSSTKNSETDEDVEYTRGQHPNSLKAIKNHQYPKGFSGNILGRKPNYEQLKQQLIKLGEEETFDYNDKSKGTRKEQVLRRIWDDAIKYGDMRKIQLLAFLGCLD